MLNQNKEIMKNEEQKLKEYQENLKKNAEFLRLQADQKKQEGK